MADYYQPGAAGCAWGAVIIGAGLAGIYHGLSHAKGTPLDKNLETF